MYWWCKYILLVHAKGLCGGGRNGDVVLLGIGEKVITTLELVDEFRNSPGGNDLHGWRKSVPSKLKANLVVALSCAAVRKDLTVILLGDADLSACNDRPGQRGAEQVAVLVDGIALGGTEDQLLDEFLLEVNNDHLLGTESERLLLDGIPVLFLAYIAEHTDNGVAIVDQPLQNCAGIKT